MSDAAQTLADLALELGADAVAWADADIPSSAVEEYAVWLRAGRHARMDYLERQLPRRADLGTSLPGAGRVLVLGISHAYPAPPQPAGGIRLGRVARYAWTTDYHDQLQPVLERLEGEAAALGVRAKGYVDHGPVMERLLGAQAALGWRSKSGMLVSTELGAFFTLAVLLTDLEPQGEDTGHPDRCGRCFRCGLSCPTGAIGPDRKIDANRCLSYLTIEHRGPLPWEHRTALGDWLFGCDICCRVCPWSEKAGPLARLFQPHAEFVYPDLSRFFGVSERRFTREWAGSALLRPRRKGMARNALNVLGNLRDPHGWPLLGAGAEDPAWEVREAAAWALAQWGEWAEVERLRGDDHESVRASVERLLTEKG
ncbi:tRNA epoxyqueuosine(34) reductase QueG [Deinococcus radiophilus]|uniref:tRNA epoxyqueuosine(34) reductase QueG n=1 Tax=Deinococcus radiophilus TaxID=32062 RepID=A0A431W5R3_9DEIO|nr:tRNA epoxyqueuosine(34) reductase QueG [Deinococcus radiophilus]RTR30835.1 tRNA epoxyqueuosine(34) reductase QueG [Deinococcus radiophilus]UFA49415.1 tRNA epoxyqueuosine(34) reductase QueG [Deinococcus radiophilus]